VREEKNENQVIAGHNRQVTTSNQLDQADRGMLSIESCFVEFTTTGSIMSHQITHLPFFDNRKNMERFPLSLSL
jgi:hypothetical protein